MDLVHLGGRSPRLDYEDFPRSPRRSRKNSHNIPPAAPDVPGAQEPPSPTPRRRETARDSSRYRDRDSDWDRRQDDEFLLRTPESRASSSSYHQSRPRYYGSDSRRDLSTTPSHSVASSMTSVATPHPPRSSATRQSQIPYRRPSVSVRGPSCAEYDDELIRERRRSPSQSRSIRVVPSPPRSRRPSRPVPYASSSSSDSEDDSTEEAYDSQDDRRRPRSHRETQLVLLSRSRYERSRSRADTAGRGDQRSRRREESVRRDVEDHDETDSRGTPSLDEIPRDRTPSRIRSRPQSRPASVKRIRAEESDHEHDADSDEPPARELRDRLELRGSHKERHSSRVSRDHKQNRSQSYSKRSAPSKRYVLPKALPEVDHGSSHRVRSSSKRYYESEDRCVEKRETYHPPSASHRRSKTVSVSGSMAASHHQSVSSSTKRSSTFLGSIFGSSHYGQSQHQSPAKPVKLYPCVICMDERPARKMAKLKCGHRMCNSCLKRSFKLSITDPQHMPPRCCTTDFIPLKHVDQLFDRTFKKNWNKKFVEYSARTRVYCPKRNCGLFIRPEDIRRGSDGKKYGQCGKCATKVCVQCNGKLHKGRDCPKDEETVRFLAQAKDEGWQRCAKCKAVIELQEGCNHMTCRCGAEFCYVCGAKWKSCECPWFNYDTVEADRILHMEIPRFPARPTVDIPLNPHRGGRPGEPGLRPQNYEEELLFRRIQQEQDERYARSLQDWREDERDDDFQEGFGDITGLGNAASHFLNDDFRPRMRNIGGSQPPPPHAPAIPIDPAPMFDRTGYVHDVNRARGVRANSMTRLADRFNARPPPPMPTAATMPLPSMPPAIGPPGLAPGLPIRRHTAETAETGVRSVERPSGRIVRPIVYEEPEQMIDALHANSIPMVHKQHAREPPKGPLSSALAGLSAGGSYKNRVHEWRMYVGGNGMMEPPAEIDS